MRTGRASWRAVAVAAACGRLWPEPASPFDCNGNRIDDFAEIQNSSVPDCDQNGSVNVTDPVHTLQFLFRGGPPPGPCGLDTDPPGSPGDLGCAEYASC